MHVEGCCVELELKFHGVITFHQQNSGEEQQRRRKRGAPEGEMAEKHYGGGRRGAELGHEGGKLFLR